MLRTRKAIFSVLSGLIFISVFYIFSRTTRGQFDIKKTKMLQAVELESAYFCLTRPRVSFDKYLERNGRYDYLNADINSFPRKKETLTNNENNLNQKNAKNTTIFKKDKYFFSINLHNNEEAIPYMIKELMQLFKYLGAENLYLSIYENGSMDKSKVMLNQFSIYLKKFDIKHSIVTDERSRPENSHRIDYLATVRNRALEPLEKEKKVGRVYDKIIFMNDIYFCRNDILELIYQSNFQGSDFTCPLDFHSVPAKGGIIEFRDSWVARDIEGNKFNPELEAVSNHPDSRLRNGQNLPFQVQCSWNGVGVLNSKPFYGKKPLRFRRSHVGTGECSASECSLLCNDFWSLGYRRIIVVPEILVFYRLKNAALLDPKYDLAINITQTLDEKIKYIDGPEKILCIGMEGVNAIDPDQPGLWVNYTNDGTKVI
ncbi:Alpha-1,3-mannosyltransferase CMT1 [Smittium mucronatum]|uniref:Alpha-1,3-mannosyltransferase CMT1 n=1 Tax=Smittium mucronatum TaxID=133383 RepID=A0A1R0GYD6_9FUNG|nr:Alpha-1,3-mannosyltransferase CMT1 [Smittium mucronatum]